MNQAPGWLLYHMIHTIYFSKEELKFEFLRFRKFSVMPYLLKNKTCNILTRIQDICPTKNSPAPSTMIMKR
jgi:hypothetical protein